MTSGGASVVTANGGQPPNGNLERRVAVIEAVLPTLATKADVAELGAELRTEMHSANEKVGVDIFSANGKLRAEMRSENEKLLAAIRVENANLREQLLLRIALVHEETRSEVQKMHNSMFKWMVTTMITMLIAYSGFFIGLANVLLAHVPPTDAAKAGTSKSAITLPRQGPAFSP